MLWLRIILNCTVKKFLRVCILDRVCQEKHRCVLITSDPKLQTKEEGDIIRENVINKALAIISDKTPEWFAEKVCLHLLR